MTLAIRVIPCLDVADGRVVKGVNFQNLRDSGDPVELASSYFQQGADEITFLDVNATLENRRTMFDLVAKTAEQVFIPLTVGGGIRSTSDVADLLAAGADKISIGSAAVQDPDLISRVAERFGNQVVVISLDLKRNASMQSGYTVTTHGGRRATGLDAADWIREVIERGAGELLVNSIDSDGTRTGFDNQLLKLVRELSSVPIIASGGAGSPADFSAAAKAGADAILAASIFHFGEVTIADVKQRLASDGFEVRL
jgi:cyclase